MMAFLADGYLWILALHILSFIAWMAGLLMLPRYFVYHADTEIGSDASAMLQTMEAKLRKIILTPAMIATWVFGLMLMVGTGALSSGGWFHVKLVLVLVLSGFHGFLIKLAKEFQNDKRQRSHKFYRKINEVPFVLAIGIVFLVILKPF